MPEMDESTLKNSLAASQDTGARELTTEEKAARYDQLVASDDCLARVKPGEPIFVLRAQDLLPDTLVRCWALLAEKGNTPDSKAYQAVERANAMAWWSPRKHPD